VIFSNSIFYFALVKIIFYKLTWLLGGIHLENMMKTIHATGVYVGDKGILIIGESGSGKSTLALSLIACGAKLICDDRANLRLQDDNLIMSKPPTLPSVLEIRGFGLISVPLLDEACVDLIVDLATDSDSRLGGHKKQILGVDLPCIKGRNFYRLSDALIVWSKFGGFQTI